jgi:pimeloyl-ACP methyl ester carboxylesterase
MDDLRAVMDAAGIGQSAVLGISEGGSLSVLFAATYPDRCSALVLYGGFPRSKTEAVDAFLSYIDQAWGTGSSLPLFAPSRENDPAFRHWWSRFERLGASPASVAALMRMYKEIDVRGILPTIQAPTLVIHRTGDRVISVGAGRSFAPHIESCVWPGDERRRRVTGFSIKLAEAQSKMQCPAKRCTRSYSIRTAPDTEMPTRRSA